MGLKPGGDPARPLRPALRTLNTATGAVGTVASWSTPSAHHPGPGEHLEFTGVARRAGGWLQCTRTEVLVMSAVFQVQRVISHPLFHDVHHAIPWRGGVAVASTGIDAILLLSADGELRERYDLGDGRWCGEMRTVAFKDTKPRAAHPNYLFDHRGELWATCLERGAAVHLRSGAQWTIPHGPPHDGVAHAGLVWFTTVDGWLLGMKGGQVKRALALHELEGLPGLPGWCRSLFFDGDDAYVGMTTLRRSKHRDALSKLLRGRAGQQHPTRVLRVHLPSERITGSWEVGNAAGGTLYGISPWMGAEAPRSPSPASKPS